MNEIGEPARRIHVQARGLLFDMDGILVSSLGSVERSWSKWASRHGMDVTATVRAAHGRRAIDTLHRLLPEGDHAAELKIIEDFEVEDTADVHALEGVMRILESLPAGSWTVVTSATDRLARVRLRSGGIPIPEKIITGDTVKSGKPSPEPYLRGAEILGMPPGDCIVFEDAGAGVEAGHAAGARVLATTFSHPLAELAGADWIVRSLADVSVSVLEDHRTLELAFEPLRVRMPADQY